MDEPRGSVGESRASAFHALINLPLVHCNSRHAVIGVCPETQLRLLFGAGHHAGLVRTGDPDLYGGCWARNVPAAIRIATTAGIGECNLTMDPSCQDLPNSIEV